MIRSHLLSSKCWIVVVACFAMSYCAAYGGELAPKKISNRGSAHFAAVLHADKASLAEGEEISFLLLLYAGTKRPWFIHVPIEEGIGGDFYLSIREHGSSRQVRRDVWHHASQLPMAPTLSLAPSGTIIGGESADTAANFGMHAGHMYDVTAVYRSTIPIRTLHGIPVLSINDGDFTSKNIQVSVTR